MGTASDAVLTLAKGQCDEDLQKVITHVTSFLANVQSMNRQFGGHSPETGVGETALKESSPQDPSSQSRRGLDPESRDTHTLVLCDILRVSTEMINTPVERFLAQPTSCVYFAKKVRAIGNTWEISPLWPGQNWYFQSLLAVSRFSRTVKWYQADQRTAHLLGNDTDESWSFFLSKPPRWYQKGPKGKILAPWKASLMDYGLLPPDLPVLQEEEPDYLVLRDLQLKSADPLSHSFRNPVVDDASAPESIKDFDIIKSIHKGESKAVFLAKRRPTGENFVVKVLEKGEMFAKNKITIIHAKRTAVLHQTDSHFVNKIHFAFQSKTKVYLVKELLSQGDCGALIRSLGHIEEDTARDYVCQIVHGLEHLHNQGITHRDLRPENILIDHAHRLSLTDFGVSQKTLLSHHIGPGSRQMDDSSMLKHRLTGTQFLRSVYYITPETILGLQDDDASIDWWAFGIITYEFMYGGTPFEDDNEDLELVFQKILSGKIDWNRDPIFIFAPSIAPSIAARDFIRSLLNPDPASRCSFRGADGVKAHRFFDDIRPNIRTAANVSSQSSSRSASQNLRQHLPDTSNSVPSGPSASPPSPKPSERSLGNASAGQAEGSRKRPSSLTLNQRRTSQESSTDPSPTRRRRSSSGRSTPYSAGKYWPGLRRRTSSRNSSDGRGSGWLSGYTTTDSDPETDESSISSRFPSAYSSQREYNVPGYNLPSHQILLNDLDLTGKVSKIGKYPFESGAVADIYRGTLKSSTSPVPVAVKIFRRMHAERETLERTSRYLYQEARIWRQLDHPNILPFLGISLDLGLSPALISPYCAAGPIMKYLHNNDQTKRLQMVIGVANGLNYLHSEGIVHGNLCTKKILVDGDGSPVICGYGTSKALRQPAYTTSLFSSPIRFAAPECFSVKGNTSSVRTSFGDVYSFSMVTLEILSGLQPYHHLPTEHAVFINIVRGGRPARTHLDPSVITSRMWRFFTSLWHDDPTLRPEMPKVLQALVRLQDKEDTTDESNSRQVEEPSCKDGRDWSSSSGSEASDSLGDIALPELNGRDLKGRVTQDDQYPFAGGGNSNIYRGKLTRSNGRKIRVAIKMIRMSDDGSGQLEEIVRRLRREVDVWSQLRHKYVLPFIGVCDDIAPWPVLVSPFYKFGHVATYLKKNPSTDRQALVRGVASGLQYLHSQNIVHGDLKVQNVLVDKRGSPCICDFGISKIINRQGFTTSSVGTAPYMAPELFFVVDGATQDESSPSTTKRSDVYSFALLVLEILTSEPPKGRPSRPIVTAKILADLRPKQSEYDEKKVAPEIWAVLNRCWTFEPQLRPAISEVRRELNSIFQPKTADLGRIETEFMKYMDISAESIKLRDFYRM